MLGRFISLCRHRQQLVCVSVCPHTCCAQLVMMLGARVQRSEPGFITACPLSTSTHAISPSLSAALKNSLVVFCPVLPVLLCLACSLLSPFPAYLNPTLLPVQCQSSVTPCVPIFASGCYRMAYWHDAFTCSHMLRNETTTVQLDEEVLRTLARLLFLMGVKSLSGKNNTHCFIVNIMAVFKARIRHGNRVDSATLPALVCFVSSYKHSFIYYKVVMDIASDPRGWAKGRLCKNINKHGRVCCRCCWYLQWFIEVVVDFGYFW